MDVSDLTFEEDLIIHKLIPCESPSRITLKDGFFTSSAVLFSIMPYKNRPYDLILIHRTNTGTRHRGEMSFPGGKFEFDYDNSLEDTALRETEEEIGVPRKNIRIIGCLDDFPTMTQYIITPYVGIINEDQKLVKDPIEVQEIVKIPIDFFINKTNFREQVVNINGNKFPVFYFNYLDKENGNKYTVWGATAYLISNFIERVYGYDLSELGLKRFKIDKMKQVKEYIKYRNHITKDF